jgi:ADP-heptose:LPS heptosyltransferase/glycosyltransferase involved in cell wall biosynthesis
MTLARKEPLSLVLFSHTQGVDGAGRSLLDLVRGLLDRGAICNVVVPAVGPLQEHLLALGSGVLVAPPECTPWQWGIIGAPPPQDFAQAYGGLMAKVLPQVQKLAPDFIISQTIVSPWGLVCAKALKIPHALSAREYGDLDHGIAVFGGFKEAVADLYHSSEIVFSVTQDVARHLFGVDPEHKVEVIYSNIEADDLFDRQPSTLSVDEYFPPGVVGPVVCLAGTFTPGKGQIDLIRATIAMREAGHSVRCLLIGAQPTDSAYVSEVRALIAASAFKDNFAVLDFTPSIYGLLRQVDVVVSCSRHEALGRTLIEASLLDKPIVYTNSGGWKEVFENGVHGLAYEAGDHRQLTDCLLRTIEDPIAAGVRMSAAKAYCEARFNSENYAEKVHSKLKTYLHAHASQSTAPVNVLERIEIESVQELASKREAVAGQLQTTQLALESAQQLAVERAVKVDKLQAGLNEAQRLAYERAAEMDRLHAGVDEAQKVIAERGAQIAQQAAVIASREERSRSHKQNQGNRGKEMRIAIGLAEHIGDIVACEPVARYLKLRYPGCTLVWVVSRAYRALVESNPHVDEVVTIGCLTEWIQISRHQKFDKIVDLHVNYRVCEHCRIPLIKQHGNPFINVYEWLNQGALLEAFSLGAGLPKLSAAPRMYLGEAQQQAVDALGLPETFVAVHRESNDLKKDWMNEGWTALADLLDALNLPIVEVGTSKGEQASPLAGRSIDLLNRTSVLETAEVIRRARFFVGVDSGPAHLANAVQTPGIVLLGRLGWFRQYTVYTGLYASDAPVVKLVRNLQGHANELPISDVLDAVSYVADMLAEVGDGLPAMIARYVEAPPSLPPGAIAQSFPLDSASKQELLASPLFDAAWYQLHYPHVAASGMEPVEHYLSIGGLQGCKPSAAFDSAGYLATNPDIRAAGYNPLLHFIRHGGAEDRRGGLIVDERFFPADGKLPGSIGEPRSMLSDHPAVSDAFTLSPFEPAAPRPILESEFPRTYAFYLSQFHPIAENNWAHGMGFTEWNNVIQTEPLFPTHDQPKVPGELGYYDLRALDVMREQVRLAQEHGITGFCFYYYYFHGKRLLYKPVENYINSDLKMPFFFLWANENWSKRWDGGDKEVIIAQQHSKEDDLAFIRGLFPIFEDERYTKINGKPILCVYKTHLFPDIVATTDLWREEAVRHGFPGLYLVMVDDWIPDVIPRIFGFDASYEIPSNVIPADVLSTEVDTLGLSDAFTGRIVDYEKFARFHVSRPFPEYKRFRTVMLPWDNTARYGQRAIVHINTGGDAYKLWLSQALLDTYERYPAEERIVFLHSWNEWCEGTYLEPDRRQGRRHLEETRDTIELARKTIRFQANGEHGEAFGLLRRIQREKDEGAYRLLQAARLQLMWKYKDSERVQEELVRQSKRVREELLQETERAKAELAREKQEWIYRQPVSMVLGAMLRKIYRGGLRRLGLR